MSKTATAPAKKAAPAATVTKGATLASMAPKKTASAAAPVADKPAVTNASVIDWSGFGDAEVAAYTRNASRTAVDREATTPEFIKRQVTLAFEKTAHNKGKGVWMTLNLGTRENVESFLKAGKLYARFREFTMRGEPRKDQSNEVRFMVKPKEARARKAA